MKRLILPVLAAGLAGAMLPISGSSPATAAPADDFGYSSLTSATPVWIEFYEPTIPIPATPQFELLLGYSKVVADSTSSRGRASFLWPSDAVGEGSKTIVENLGLPKELSGPIAAQGYPVQVNSTYPSGPETEKNEPFPGTVMRTTAKEGKTVAQNGYSSECSFDDTEGEAEGEGEGGGEPPIPGLPGIPLLETLGLGGESSSGSGSGSGSAERSTTSRSAARSASDEEEESCQIPAELAALVSVGGYTATSRVERTSTEVESVSTSAVGGIKLIGGVIEISGVTSKVTSSSDGSAPKGKGKAAYGTLSIGGQEFTLGPDGAEAAGQSSPIPGLPNDPAKALETLGVTITVPKPTFDKDGKEIESTIEALIVEIDAATLSDALRQLPFEEILGQLPKEMKELKKAIQAAVYLSPRIVIHLGSSSSKVETAEPLELPAIPVPDNDPAAAETETGATGGSSGTPSTGGLSGTGTVPASSVPTGAETGALPEAELAAGLPKLFSIPTLLFLAALGGAVVAGSYVRRMGALALGGGGACSHGLDSGLPDLRKIQ